MKNTNLPEIEFEGKIVKPTKTGIYRCPFNCQRSGYPALKWKTEKGFMQHMEKCTGKPSYKKEVDIRVSENIEKSKKLIDEFLINHPIESSIFISTYYVTKPTHVQKFNRMVRVRYEEERRYYAAEITINSLQPVNGYYPNFLINFGYDYRKIQIFDTLKEAEKHAYDNQKLYDKSCEESSSFK